MGHSLLAPLHAPDPVPEPSAQPTARDAGGFAWSHAAVLFGVYLALRLTAWAGTVVAEDHDSMGYLRDAAVFSTWDLRQILALHLDATPVYPFLTAALSLSGIPLDVAARLCSLTFSILLFAAVLGLGRHLVPPRAVLIGLLLLSCNAVLVPLSFSILSEPAYLALVYLGLWLFWSQHRSPVMWKAVLLGFVFGIAFLDRIEGLLFLGFIPVLQLVHRGLAGRHSYPWRRALGWSAIFVIVFGLVAAPWIWRVSRQMGEFAINGREVWSAFNIDGDERALRAKIYGLDYSPTQINLYYLQRHPEARAERARSGAVTEYVKLAARNFDVLYHDRLGELFGPFVLALFGAGVAALYLRRRYFELFFVASLIGVGVFAPLLHKVSLRYVAVIAPLVLLLAGLGAVEAARLLAPTGLRRHHGRLAFGIAIVAVLASAVRLHEALLPDPFNQDYSPAALAAPIAALKEAAQQEGIVAPGVAGARTHFAYFAGGRTVMLPFADYPGLVDYLRANRVDFFLFERRLLERDRYPFLDHFTPGAQPPDFVAIHRGADHFGGEVVLYRVRPVARQAAR